MNPLKTIIYYTYVLRSKKDYRLYTGAPDNLRKRFSEHNLGLVKSTKSSPVRAKLPTATVNSNRGYIALISAIIISALLIIITFSVNFSSFFARFNILDSEYKKVSTGLAEACVDTAMLELAKGNVPASNTCVNVGDACPTGPKICKICSVSQTATTTSKYDIKTKSIYQKAATNLLVKVTTTTSDVLVGSWEEVPSNSSCTVP